MQPSLKKEERSHTTVLRSELAFLISRTVSKVCAWILCTILFRVGVNSDTHTIFVCAKFIKIYNERKLMSRHSKARTKKLSSITEKLRNLLMLSLPESGHVRRTGSGARSREEVEAELVRALVSMSFHEGKVGKASTTL